MTWLGEKLILIENEGQIDPKHVVVVNKRGYRNPSNYFQRVHIFSENDLVHNQTLTS